MRIFLEYLKVSLWMLPIILPALWLLPRLSKRYAARVSYVIWLVLAVRLLIPWNLTLPQETAPIHVAISEEQANEWVQAKFNPVQAPPKAEGTAAAAQKQTQPQAEPLQPLQIGFALWLAGVLFFALRTAVSVFRMKALLRRWEKEPSAEAKAFFAETAGKTQPRLMVCPVLESPMAVGLFRTTVYLPHEHYTAQELEMIFRHELIHWRRICGISCCCLPQEASIGATLRYGGWQSAQSGIWKFPATAWRCRAGMRRIARRMV